MLGFEHLQPWPVFSRLAQECTLIGNQAGDDCFAQGALFFGIMPLGCEVKKTPDLLGDVFPSVERWSYKDLQSCKVSVFGPVGNRVP